MSKVNILFDLSRLFFIHPWASIKKLRLSNFRKLLSAINRHDQETVIQVAQQELNIENSLARLSHRNKLTNIGINKIKELEKCYPGITDPVGLKLIPILEEKLRPPKYIVDSDAPVRVNVLLPQLDPSIIFGGYISCLQFIRKMQTYGFRIRILLCETGLFDRTAVEAKLSSNPILMHAVSNAEIENITFQNSTTVISPEDAFICYSYWTGFKAHHFAKAVNSQFIFFLQEYEAIFHPHDSCYAIAKYIYSLPHKAIFNTTLLADYFRKNKLGVFGRYKEEELERSYVTYQHALTPSSPPPIEELRSRKTKRLLFYGRPENHARRNLFEIAVIGLKMAVCNGVFDSAWEFRGIGTLGAEHMLELGNGHKMMLGGTLSQSDYGEALSQYDIGLSLMLAPHPSILPFEMASAGQIVVTNSFETRSAATLKDISDNIEPCEAYPDSVCHSLAIAVSRIRNYEDRIRAANLKWVNNWEDSFNDDVMKHISEMIRS